MEAAREPDLLIGEDIDVEYSTSAPATSIGWDVTRDQRETHVNGVALVHDYINQRGGAERVVLELAKIWPGAAIHTTFYRPHSTFQEFRAHDIRTSFVDRLPVDSQFRALLPIYPAAIRDLGVLDHDLVVSSSSGWAHGVRTSERAFHVCYCHNPARWLYTPETYVRSRRRRAALAPLTGGLRRWDRAASRRPDLVIANAKGTQERIRRAWGIEAPVVHPPVNVDGFTPRPRGERLLVLSRLLGYKRVDLIVEAATREGIELDIVGTGPVMPQLKAMAGPTVTFHGAVSQEEVRRLLESCRALCLPGTEDFGIVPLEANAAGKPVVAFGAGGALETMTEHTAAFFSEPTVDACLGAIRRADQLESSPYELAAHARNFSSQEFGRRLLEVIAERRGATALPDAASAHAL